MLPSFFSIWMIRCIESFTGKLAGNSEGIGLYMHIRLGWMGYHPSLRATVQYIGKPLRGCCLYDVGPQDYLDFVHDFPCREYLKPDRNVGRCSPLTQRKLKS
jgi:hypothetical protein